MVGNPLPTPRTLPNAELEASEVLAVLSSKGWATDALLKERATKSAFLNGAGTISGINSGKYGHIHLAQHTVVKERGRSYLVFARQPSASNEEEYLCAEGEVAAAILDDVDCVVAATCVSALSRADLNEYVGLGAAFLQAGVGLYIGTLYPLSDLGSRKLVSRLYRLRFEEGLSWSDALRLAQLAMAGSRGEPRSSEGSFVEPVSPNSPQPSGHDQKDKLSIGPDLHHPYHWAAFAAMGTG